MKRPICLMLAAALLTVSAPAAGAAAAAPSTWAASEVHTAISKDLVPAALESRYTTPITREEFATLVAQVARAWCQQETLAQILQDRSRSLDDYTFKDTKSDAVRFCAALNIVDGDGNGYFHPNNTITRQKAAKMLMYACDALTLSVQETKQNSTAWRGVASWELPHAFADGALVRVWARDPIMWCAREGVMQGTGQNQFEPNGVYTREQSILTALRMYYLNGYADQITAAKLTDDYPLDGSVRTGTEATSWIDSMLAEHTADEISHIADPNAAYGFIADGDGTGTIYGHVIDRTGKMQFTNLYGTGGKFSRIVINGGNITFYLAYGLAHDADAPYYFTLDTKTGKTTPNTAVSDPAEAKGPAQIVSVGTGWYALENAKGKKLSETYQNALEHAGGSFYYGWTADQTYALLYCDGANEAKVLYTGIANRYRQFASLGGGLYGVQTDKQTVRVLDAFGQTYGTVALGGQVIGWDSANGLVRVSQVESADNGYNYYLQDGTDAQGTAITRLYAPDGTGVYNFSPSAT